MTRLITSPVFSNARDLLPNYSFFSFSRGAPSGVEQGSQTPVAHLLVSTSVCQKLIVHLGLFHIPLVQKRNPVLLISIPINKKILSFQN